MALIKKYIAIIVAITLGAMLLSSCFENTPSNNPTFEDESTEKVDLYNSTDFSEEKAVTIYKDNSGINCYKAGVLDTDGAIKELEDVYLSINEANEEEDEKSPSNWSDFSQGYAYISYTDNFSDNTTAYQRFVIFNTKGKVTALSPLDADYTILCGGEGLFLVKQETKPTITEDSMTRLGVINHKGDWVCELADPNKYHSVNIYDSTDTKYMYCGEGVFSFTYSRLGYEIDTGLWTDLFNSKTNKYTSLENMKLITNFSKNIALLKPIFTTHDNKDINDFKTLNIYSINSNNFQEQPIFYDVYCNGAIGYKSGFKEFLLQNDLVLSDGYIFGIDNLNFFDTNGKIVVTLPGYDYIIRPERNCPGFYKFVDGVAAVSIWGKDGEEYVSSVNEKGELLYEPIKVYSCINYDFQNNTIAVKIEQNINGVTEQRNAFINSRTGEIDIRTFSTETNGKWCNGINKIEDHFIDMNGNTIITYLE